MSNTIEFMDKVYRIVPAKESEEPGCYSCAFHHDFNACAVVDIGRDTCCVLGDHHYEEVKE